jgi:DNA-binding beta-propeller fold protein YncE
MAVLGNYLAAAEPTHAPLRLKQSIPLPGVEGRLDHFGFDPTGDRLFVSALGNNTVEVLDLRRGERVHTIRNLGAPQGVVYVPELNRLIIANDKGGVCDIYDAKSFQVIGKVDFNDDADNVRYDSVAKRIYVGFGSGGVGIINAVDGKQVSSIKLAAHPEAFELEKRGDRIFVNIPTAGHVAVVDRKKNEVISNWRTDGASGNFPMALDEVNHRLFVGCRIPPSLIVLDTDSGSVVSKNDIAGDPDDIFYDSKRHLIYAICGAGEIDVIEQTDANNYKTLAKIQTADGARTGFFVPQLDILFVAVPHRGSQAAEVRCYQVK